MDEPANRDRAEKRPDPLAAIGLVVLALMLVPVLLYSMVPEGPVKEGDLVFATDRHRVALMDPAAFHHLGYEGSCLIERREQLLVLRRVPGEPERTVIARPISTARRGAPFCPPEAELFLKPHQASLKIDLWASIEDQMAGVLSRWR